VQDLRSLFDRQAGKEAQLDDAALLLIELGQTAQSVVERHQVQVALLRHGNGFVERKLAGVGAALGGVPVARVVHQDAADQLRRHAEEMCAVLPLHAALVDQLHPGFVDQGGALQRVAGAFAAQIAVGQPP
jgi:hypothetical protein